MRHTFRYAVTGALEAGGTVELTPPDSHHLARVVRRTTGDGIEVIDDTGRIWPATVDDLGPPVRARLAAAPRSGPPALPVDLFLGILDWGRLDLVIEKCTELGVDRIGLFTSERARRRVDQEAFDRRLERMGRLADAAARQSGRGTRPRLHGLVPFSAMVDEAEVAQTFLVDAHGDEGLGESLRGRSLPRATIVVGPEAGFAVAELDRARACGIAVCRLGEATLRAETAALVATTVAADALGFLGGGG